VAGEGDHENEWGHVARAATLLLLVVMVMIIMLMFLMQLNII
jgi:hypothetical protein